MSLKGKFSNDFNPKIRDRGVAYFRSGAVEILEHSDTHVNARVKGTVDYLVRLELGANSFNVACTCPYFDGGEECKHVWATMLAADNLNYLSSIDGYGPIKLLYDDSAVEELEIFSGNNHDQLNTTAQPLWQQQLSTISNSIKGDRTSIRNNWPAGREIFYIVDPRYSRSSGQLSIEIGYREHKKNGEWSKIKSARIQQSQVAKLPDETDRQLLSALAGARDAYGYGYNGFELPGRFALSTTLQHFLLPVICATGRCVFHPAEKNGEYKQVQWDDQTTWQFWLVVKRVGDDYELRPVLRSAEKEVEFTEAAMTTDAIVIDPDFRAARFDSRGALTWTNGLRQSGDFKVPAAESGELIARLMDMPSIPNLELPPQLQFERVGCAPAPHLVIRKPEAAYSPQPQLEATLFFDYEGAEIDYLDTREGIYDRNRARYVLRDRAAEDEAFLNSNRWVSN